MNYTQLTNFTLLDLLFLSCAVAVPSLKSPVDCLLYSTKCKRVIIWRLVTVSSFCTGDPWGQRTWQAIGCSQGPVAVTCHATVTFPNRWPHYRSTPERREALSEPLSGTYYWHGVSDPVILLQSSRLALQILQSFLLSFSILFYSYLDFWFDWYNHFGFIL